MKQYITAFYYSETFKPNLNAKISGHYTNAEKNAGNFEAFNLRASEIVNRIVDNKIEKLGGVEFLGEMAKAAIKKATAAIIQHWFINGYVVSNLDSLLQAGSLNFKQLRENKTFRQLVPLDALALIQSSGLWGGKVIAYPLQQEIESAGFRVSDFLTKWDALAYFQQKGNYDDNFHISLNADKETTETNASRYVNIYQTKSEIVGFEILTRYNESVQKAQVFINSKNLTNPATVAYIWNDLAQGADKPEYYAKVENGTLYFYVKIKDDKKNDDILISNVFADEKGKFQIFGSSLNLDELNLTKINELNILEIAQKIKAAKGKDGADGKDGINGKDGKDADVQKILEIVKKETGLLAHNIGLKPPVGVNADFSFLNYSTTELLAVYDNNSKYSEYGIFNAILAKFPNEGMTLAVVGKLDDNLNPLFSLFFRQILNKAGGDFSNLSDLQTYNNKARVLFLLQKPTSDTGIIRIQTIEPGEYWNEKRILYKSEKGADGNWSPQLIREVWTLEEYNLSLAKINPTIDENELFIKSNNKITTIKKWKETENNGLKHSGYLLAANYNQAKNNFNYVGRDNDEVVSLTSTKNAATNFPIDLTLTKKLPGGWFIYTFYFSFSGFGRKYNINFPNMTTTGNQKGQQGNNVNNFARNWRNNSRGRAIENIYLDYKTRVTFFIRNNGNLIEVEWSLKSTPPNLNTIGGSYSQDGAFIARNKQNANQVVIDKVLKMEIEPIGSNAKPIMTNAFITWKREVSA